jgi:GAF domain
MPDQLAMESASPVAEIERERLSRMFKQAPGFMALLEGADHRFAMANPAFYDLVGRRTLDRQAVADALPELVQQGFVEMLDNAAASREAVVARGMPLKIARTRNKTDEIYVDFVFQPLDGGIFVQGQDVSEDKRNEDLRHAHAAVLEMAVADAPLEQTLSELIKLVESTSRTGVLGSILILDEDGRHLRRGAAPSLPADYSEAIDGAEIGPCAGSCGTAAFSGRPVFVTDIATDPLWAEYKAVALPHGLRACWSTPIITSGRKVLGTFAMYHREPREPTVRDLALVDLVTQTAALVIDRARARTKLQEIAAMAGRAQSSSSS